ncbi:MAG: hypothetical protein DMG57_03785 [Acidobacteria bacterium]|nr:MAG: hypothetical protein DMG57_03785 [Acidobacteriota bacterium]
MTRSGYQRILPQALLIVHLPVAVVGISPDRKSRDCGDRATVPELPDTSNAVMLPLWHKRTQGRRAGNIAFGSRLAPDVGVSSGFRGRRSIE